VTEPTGPSLLPSRRQTDERLAAVEARIAERLTEATLPAWWSARVAQTPDSVVVRTDLGPITYRELDGLADRVAHAAGSAGLRSGDVAGIQLPSSAAFLVLILGLAKLGARLSLLSTGLRGGSLRHALVEVPPRLLFTTPGGREAIGRLEGIATPRSVVLEEEGAGDASASGLGAVEAWLARSPSPAHRGRETGLPGPDATLFYIFTSGTTGLPKATQCSHRRYLASATSEGALLEMTAADRMYVVLPMFHIAALSAIGAAISVSASVVIRAKFSASRFWRDVHAYSATTFQYLGEILRYVLAQPASDLDRPNPLRAMIGAGVTTRIWQAFEARFGPIRIVEAYGSSEGVIGIFNLDAVPGSVGRASRALEERLRIVRHDAAKDAPARGPDGRLIACEEGHAGELIARLDDRAQFEGYSSAAATRSRLIEDAFEDGDLWYRSGDLFRRVDGYYYFVERLGDTFRWKGENVSAQEVADALSGCEQVGNAVVYGVRVPGHEGSAGMALIALQPGRAFDGARLHEELARELPSHALPLFLRIGDGQAVLTETYKMGTAEMKRQGYARELIPDPIYVLDGVAGRYVPLTDEALRRVGLPPSDATPAPAPTDA